MVERKVENVENFKISDNPEYTEEIRKFEETDPAHADLFNTVVQALVNNDAFIKKVSEEHMKNAENPHKVTKSQVGLGDVPNASTNDQTPTFTQASTRKNIISGEKLSVIFGKLMKWFVDLKTVAFSGKYTDLTDKPTIPAAVRVKGNAESAYRTGDVNLTAENIGALPATKEGSFFQKLNLEVEGYSYPSNCIYTQGLDLNQVSESGLYFCSNPVNAPTVNGNGFMIAITYAGKIRGMQLYMPVGEDVIYKRQNTSDAWGTWAEIMTDTYAQKGIYGDTTVSFGRKPETVVGERSFAFGNNVVASNKYSHAEGESTIASGYTSHAEGEGTTASGEASHAEGGNTRASVQYSHSEGSYTEASGQYSHAEGSFNHAEGASSHAEGNSTYAIGDCSHAEGRDSKATGKYSHAGGYYSLSSGESSHAMGYYAGASNFSSCAIGKGNRAMNTGGGLNNQAGDVFVIGNGSNATSETSNAFRVTYQGQVYGKGAFNTSGADYAEFIKPWADGNPENEDRVGYFVTVKDGFLHKANEGDYIVGITSGNPSIVGNADEDYYWRYERDEFNRIVLEDVPETVQKTDEEGNPVFEGETHQPVMIETGKIIPNARMKLSKDYDPALQQNYIERKDRKEWDYVGMLGVLPVRNDGTCQPGQFCRCGIDGIATLAEERGFDTYMVLERISDNVVSVILK